MQSCELWRESSNPSELRGWTWLGEESLNTCPFPYSRQLLRMILAQMELGRARYFSLCEYTRETSTLVNASVTVKQMLALRLFALSSCSCGNPQKPKLGLMGAGQCIYQLTRRSASHSEVSVQAPCHSQPLSGSQANWDWIAALIWTLGVTLKDFPDTSVTGVCLCESEEFRLAELHVRAATLASEETEANPAVTQELGQVCCREKAYLCL